MINIEVVYAAENEMVMLPLSIESGSTVLLAINKSGIINHHPEIDLGIKKVGIFSTLCELNTIVNDGDRVEIYRPLKADPKVARRMRATSQRKA